MTKFDNPLSIDVWFLDLDQDEIDAAVLDDEERARAERFHFAEDRIRFVARRSMLRQLLGTYLGVVSQSVSYEFGSNGKPFVAGCSFNTSHAGSLGVVAITQDRAIGVDIEDVTAEHDPSLLLPALTPEEQRALAGGEAMVESILAIWTRKEALVKAIGVGLAVTPKRFATFVGDDGVVIDPRADHEDVWRVDSLAVPHGYVAAVAGEGSAPLQISTH